MMRASVILLAIVLAVLLLAFSVNNLGTYVPVTLFAGSVRYPLYLVVGVSVLVGAVVVGLIAVFEGAKTRLENRRLRREMHRLETELNFLRTQPASPPQDAGTAPPKPPPGRPLGPAVSEPPGGPVYAAEGADLDDDRDDDDVYSGGRAV
jgi:uncharacterized integral membrane protein